MVPHYSPPPSTGSEACIPIEPGDFTERLVTPTAHHREACVHRERIRTPLEPSEPASATKQDRLLAPEALCRPLEKRYRTVGHGYVRLYVALSVYV